MFTKPTFENNLYMRIFRWFYIGFALNISFWVVNTPYTLTAMFLAVDPRNLLWFALALLLIGPSMISLLAAIDRFAEHKDIDPVKDFCYFLRTFAVRGFSIGSSAGWGVSLRSWIFCLRFNLKVANGSFLSFFC